MSDRFTGLPCHADGAERKDLVGSAARQNSLVLRWPEKLVFGHRRVPRMSHEKRATASTASKSMNTAIDLSSDCASDSRSSDRSNALTGRRPRVRVPQRPQTVSARSASASPFSRPRARSLRGTEEVPPVAATSRKTATRPYPSFRRGLMKFTPTEVRRRGHRQSRRRAEEPDPIGDVVANTGGLLLSSARVQRAHGGTGCSVTTVWLAKAPSASLRKPM
jgi:hypothetical protein